MQNAPIFIDEQGNELDPVQLALRQIDAAALVTKLQSHVLDGACLDITQITAARVLLEHAMPRDRPVNVNITLSQLLEPCAERPQERRLLDS